MASGLSGHTASAFASGGQGFALHQLSLQTTRMSVMLHAMNRLGLSVYGVALAGVALLLGREAISAGLYLSEMHRPTMVALGCVGWLIATIGPIMLSFLAWRASRRIRLRWLPHLLFIPAAIALYRAGAALLFFVANVPDGDSIEGYALLPAIGFLGVTLVVHAGALVVMAIARITR